MTDDNSNTDDLFGNEGLTDRQYGIYQCNDCSNVALTLRDCDGGMTCHGEPMEEVTEIGMDVRPPDIKQVLLDAFGLPKPGLDICLCVIGEGAVPPSEVAEKLGYDETTVRRYLNQLVEIGLLQKSQLNREGGGIVNVYHSIDLDEMRRDTLIGFYAWAGEAAALIEEANLTKEDYLDEDYSEGLNDVFWERFEGKS
jgi:predicted transcriptional regulator